MEVRAAVPGQAGVWERYQADLAAIESQLSRGLDCEVSLVNDVSGYILNSGGKRFRPLLVAISARLAGLETPAGTGHPAVALLGSVVEYIHTATLLHDDVVDGGEIRRGRGAARTVWGNSASVLVGDFLYARALALAMTLDRLDVMRVLTRSVEEMSQGELLQLTVCGDEELAETAYIRIVTLKTASLMSAACRLGGILGGTTPERQEALAEFGLNMGIAFQVADDSLDYKADTGVFGKALGGDLQEGKVTLPLIQVLRRCSAEERARLSDIIARDEAAAEVDLRFVLDLMGRYGAIEAALAEAGRYRDRACRALEAFPQGPHRASLAALASYVIDRDR